MVRGLSWPVLRLKDDALFVGLREPPRRPNADRGADHDHRDLEPADDIFDDRRIALATRVQRRGHTYERQIAAVDRGPRSDRLGLVVAHGLRKQLQHRGAHRPEANYSDLHAPPSRPPSGPPSALARARVPIR